MQIASPELRFGRKSDRCTQGGSAPGARDCLHGFVRNDFQSGSMGTTMNRGERTPDGVRGTMATTMSAFRFFTTEQLGDATVARPVDPYLQGTALAELLKLELLQIMESTGCKTAVVDLHNVKLISSSVISSLLGVKRQLAASGIPFTLCGMSDSLRHVFRTLNMDGNVFRIMDDVDEAIASSDAKVTSYYDVCGRVSPPDEEQA